EELLERDDAGRDVATDEIRIAVFEIGWREYRTGEHALIEAGCEPFNLALDRRQHIETGSLGDVTVGPRCMAPRGCPRRIEQTRLRQQNERLPRHPSAPRVAFRSRNFLKRSTQMDGRCARARI